MKMKCPRCRKTSEFTVAAAIEDDEFDDKTRGWRLACENCGIAVEGVFSFFHKVVLTILFLIPIAVFWGAFLMYAEKCGGGKLQFLIWLVHIFVGFCISLWITTHYGAVLVLRKAAEAGVEI